MNPTTLLTTLTRTLTQPHRETHTVIDRHTGQPEQITITRQGLLTELETGASIAHTGTSQHGPKFLIAADVIDLQTEIRRELTTDLHRLNATTYSYDLPKLLQHWHDLYTASTPGHAETAVWVAVLEDWITRCKGIVEPVKQMPVPGESCPVCGSERVVDGVALWVRFVEDDPVGSTVLACRQCGVIAQGLQAVKAVLKIPATVG